MPKRGHLLIAGALLLGCGGDDIGGKPGAAVLDAIEKDGHAHVSVALSDVAAGDDVLSELPSAGVEVLQQFRHVAGLAIRITSAAAVAELQTHPDVEAFDLDASGTGGLVDSRPLIGVDEVFDDGNGLTGAGRVVVVIDTGADTDHPDLASAIVDEACICNTGEDCCPDGGSFQVGPGSSEDDAGHGTHVSGIVVGRGTVGPRGVAPGANLIAVRMMNDNRFSSTADIVASLEWVLDTHPDVDAINMSLHTSRQFPPDCDVAREGYTPPTWVLAMRDAVDKLKSAGVVTVVIAGNSGEPDAKSTMKAPGCLSNVLSVGNAVDASRVNRSSNSAATLDVLAPGTDITSCHLAGKTRSLTGTSMAAPHLAGAVALLHEAAGERHAPDDTQACLITSPTTITDSNGIETPLLHVPSALDACEPAAPPVAACRDHCGKAGPVPGSLPPCYCDDLCEGFGDCCEDVAVCSAE